MMPRQRINDYVNSFQTNQFIGNYIKNHDGNRTRQMGSSGQRLDAGNERYRHTPTLITCRKVCLDQSYSGMIMIDNTMILADTIILGQCMATFI